MDHLVSNNFATPLSVKFNRCRNQSRISAVTISSSTSRILRDFPLICFFVAGCEFLFRVACNQEEEEKEVLENDDDDDNKFDDVVVKVGKAVRDDAPQRRSRTC